jgi:hypothetical protein
LYRTNAEKTQINLNSQVKFYKKETNSASNIFTFCILTKIAKLKKLSTYTNNHIYKTYKILGIAKQPNAKVILMPES